LQHCDLNSEGEVRWGTMGALCFDIKGERVVLSPCPAQRPPSSRFQWKFIKARQIIQLYLVLRFSLFIFWVKSLYLFCNYQLSGQLVHQRSQLCVEAVKDGGLVQSGPVQSGPGEISTNSGAGGLFLRQCTHQPRQQWHFEQLVAPKGA